jgi:hypothetical protein
MKKIDSALVIKKELENELINAPEDFKKDVEEILRGFKRRNLLIKILKITLLFALLVGSSTAIYQLISLINNEINGSDNEDNWYLGFLMFFYLVFFFIQREEEKLELSTIQDMRSCLETTNDRLFSTKDDSDQANSIVKFDKQMLKRQKKDSFEKLAIAFMKYVPNAIPETLEIFGLNKKLFSLLSTIPLTDNASYKNTTENDSSKKLESIKENENISNLKKYNYIIIALIAFSAVTVFCEIIILCFIEPFEVHPLKKNANEFMKSFNIRLNRRRLKSISK